MNVLRLSGLALFLSSACAVALGAGVGAAGCGGNIDVWTCYSPDGGALGNFNTGDPSTRPAGCPCALQGPPGQKYPQGDCAWLDAGAEGGPLPSTMGTCNGQCIAYAPEFWSDPRLFLIGPPGQDAGCPSQAPEVVYQGSAGLTFAPPLECPTCTCTPLSGACGLPASITASTSTCEDAGSAVVPLGGGADWDGGCVASADASAAIQSINVAPLAVGETGCTPVDAGVPVPPVPQHRRVLEDLPGTWALSALGCVGTATGTCADLGETCIPKATGFRVCVAQLGDVDGGCSYPFSEQYVFYANVDDTRGCSPCSCTSTPGTCSAVLSVYSGSTCDTGSLITAEKVSDTKALCFDVAATPLSESIGPSTFTAGTCTPDGGMALGTIMPAAPSTFCCTPSME